MTKYTPEEIIEAARTLLKDRYEKEGHHTVVAAAQQKAGIYMPDCTSAQRNPLWQPVRKLLPSALP